MPGFVPSSLQPVLYSVLYLQPYIGPTVLCVLYCMRIYPTSASVSPSLYDTYPVQITQLYRRVWTKSTLIEYEYI